MKLEKFRWYRKCKMKNEVSTLFQPFIPKVTMVNIHSFIHLKTLVEHLLWAKHCSGCWEYSGKQDMSSLFHDACTLVNKAGKQTHKIVSGNGKCYELKAVWTKEWCEWAKDYSELWPIKISEKSSSRKGEHKCKIQGWEFSWSEEHQEGQSGQIKVPRGLWQELRASSSRARSAPWTAL